MVGAGETEGKTVTLRVGEGVALAGWASEQAAASKELISKRSKNLGSGFTAYWDILQQEALRRLRQAQPGQPSPVHSGL